MTHYCMDFFKGHRGTTNVFNKKTQIGKLAYSHPSPPYKVKNFTKFHDGCQRLKKRHLTNSR